MVTRLEKILKRELSIDGQAYVVTIAPDGLKVTLKGRRKGIEIPWRALVSGDAALAAALSASAARLSAETPSSGEPPGQSPPAPGENNPPPRR